MLIEISGVVDSQGVGDDPDPERRHCLVVLARSVYGSELPDLFGYELLGSLPSDISNGAPGELNVLTVVETALQVGTLNVCHQVTIRERGRSGLSFAPCRITVSPGME